MAGESPALPATAVSRQRGDFLSDVFVYPNQRRPGAFEAFAWIFLRRVNAEFAAAGDFGGRVVEHVGRAFGEEAVPPSPGSGATSALRAMSAQWPSRQFNFELASQGQGNVFQKLDGDGGLVGREQPVERGRAGLHAAGQCCAGDAAALHLSLNLPRDHTLERAGLALRERTVLHEEIVEVRADVLFFHGLRVTYAAAFSPVANLPAESSAIS